MTTPAEPKFASSTTTDCRSETGITVGLVDGLIAIARVLVHRPHWDQPVREALRDLAADEDVAWLLERGESATPATTGAQLARARQELRRRDDLIAELRRQLDARDRTIDRLRAAGPTAEQVI